MFRFTCSVLLWGGRGAADKCHWPVWGALAVIRPHWVCPRSWQVCVLSPYTLLRLPTALYGAGPVWRAVPGFGSSTKAGTRLGILCLPCPSSSGSQELDGRTLPGCGVPHPLRGPSLSFHACRSGVPCVCSGELVSSRDPPSGCQPSRISGSLWLETGGLFAVW